MSLIVVGAVTLKDKIQVVRVFVDIGPANFCARTTEPLTLFVEVKAVFLCETNE